ncbi:MAG: hypothetical protein KKA73_07865 [Chloroflexi bacterium]|nr:hypothetical protein [Chloroflexota bacterium]MBU1747589.1 hypothetical protein [Chloroflexota bacterium]
MPTTYTQSRRAEDYGTAHGYFLDLADQSARAVIPGALFDREEPLLEAPSTTGGKLYYTAVYTSPGSDQTDHGRAAVVVHIYGSTAQAVVERGANTTTRTMTAGQTARYVTSVRSEKQHKGYDYAPLATSRISEAAFMAASPMGQLAGVQPPPGTPTAGFMAELDPACFPTDLEQAQRIIATAVRYHLQSLREWPRDKGVSYGYVRISPSATGRWWKVGWICGFGCAITPAGEVAPLTDAEMAAEAAAIAGSLDPAASLYNARMDLQSLLGILTGRDDLDLRHVEALMTAALSSVVTDAARADSDPATLELPTQEVQMKTCSVMQRLVTQLLEQHGVDLAYPDAYLKLRLPGESFMPLMIERIGPTRLSVSHYYVCDEWSGELAADPDVEIFIGYDQWVPLAIQHPAPFGYMVAAELSDDGQRVERLNRKAQANLAAFVNQWARNLKAQGFLSDRATVERKKTWPAETPDVSPMAEITDPAIEPEATPSMPDALVTAATALTVRAVLSHRARSHENELFADPAPADLQPAAAGPELPQTAPALATMGPELASPGRSTPALPVQLRFF